MKSYIAELREILNLKRDATMGDIVYHTNCLQRDVIATHKANERVEADKRRLREAVAILSRAIGLIDGLDDADAWLQFSGLGDTSDLQMEWSEYKAKVQHARAALTEAPHVE